MGLHSFCLPEVAYGTNGTAVDPDLARLKSSFRIIMVGLTTIILHFLLQIVEIDAYPVAYYEVFVEDVAINSFLVAGLYCAVLLTVERYLLIRKPHKKRLFNIEHTVILKIGLVFIASILIHCPMVLQNTAKRSPSGRIIKGNNQKLLCNEPWWTIFNYYKMFRELLRFFCVALLISLNIIIAKNLQVAKKNRRLLIKRNSTPEGAEYLVSTPTKEKAKRDISGVMRSFTEKKLTALMIAICLIYAIGNIPQMVVMVVQNEALESMYSFQLFRNCANTLEVLNHCLNFFIFCMASSEYSRAFLLNCLCLRRILLRIPACAAFIHARRLNSNFSAFDQRDLPSIVLDDDRRTSLWQRT
ncbi:Protein C17H11.1 [Aphelenchoides avenae]|nr:Protein C17H11.1 [Aphelenchus avenae]